MNEKQLRQLEETLEKYDLPPEIKSIVSLLIETVYQQALENEQLKDEIRRLKGLPKNPHLAKKDNRSIQKHPLHPKFEPPTKPQQPPPSETKFEAYSIDEEIEIASPSENCPHCDVPLYSRGSKPIVIQELLIRPQFTRFHLHRKSCPNCAYFESAKLPTEYQGFSYGPELRAIISILHYEHRMTEPQILAFLRSCQIQISTGEVNRILMNNGLLLEEMSEHILREGKKHSKQVGIDDTKWWLRQIGKHLFTVCNRKFSYFQICAKRNAEIVEELINPEENPHLGITSDDHSSFEKAEIKKKQLCWVHEGRHYEKLNPFLKWNVNWLEKKLTQLWKYYRKIQKYRKKPTEEKKVKLKKEFEQIFQEKTGYAELDERLELTYKKRERLLLCLEYPELEPHNNESEQTLRHAVKIRNISLCSRSNEGELALTTHLTFFGTCKKLGFNLKEKLIAFLKQPFQPQLHFQFS